MLCVVLMFLFLGCEASSTPTPTPTRTPTPMPTPTPTPTPEFAYSVVQVIDKCVGSSGSGFFVDYKGLWLVTNYHVINEDGDICDTVSIKLHDFNNEYDAKVVDFDEDLDLALLKTEITRLFEPLSIREDRAIVGESVRVLGFPKGLGFLVPRNGKVEKVDEERIETGMREVNRLKSTIGGHSGGPVLDEDGEVIGVHRASMEGTSIAIAVPIHHVLELVDGLTQ